MTVIIDSAEPQDCAGTEHVGAPAVSGSPSVPRAVRCAAELTERSDGWHLTLRFAGAGAAPTEGVAALLSTGLHPQRHGALTVAISPNLVPGHPFDLVDIQVIVEPTGLGPTGIGPTGLGPPAPGEVEQ